MTSVFKTVHGTFLYWGDDSEVRHGSYDEINPDELILVDTDLKVLLDRSGSYLADIFPHDHGLGLRSGDQYFSARTDTPVMGATASVPAWWECIWMVPQTVASAASQFNISPEQEAVRFGNRIREMNAAGEPIKLYCGAGGIPKPGFLNLDITIMNIGFAMTNPHEYFIFPFADVPWPIEDSTIDYICHEDCVEHLTQQQQIQFLAESFRVLKPGCYHRVNTPNLIASMKRHSDWSKGWEGTYKGELVWGHVCLFSPESLKEIAEMIGYAKVIPGRMSHGLSEYAIPETRPRADRDEIDGNVIVDLLKL